MSDDALPEADRLGDLPHPRETYRLRGQNAAEAEIVSTLKSGKIPHAWLIGGSSGLGKATLAYRFARTVLKQGASDDFSALESLQMDPEHPVARLIEAQSHPDLVVLRRRADEKTKRLKTALTVDEVRRLHSVFHQHASAGGWRVAIIDSADDMNRSAANALLKILEEPPPRSLILLIAHRPARLLPTIRSRCRKLTLEPLGDEDLGHILTDFETELKPDQRQAAFGLADGSAGRLLSLASGDGLTLYEGLSALMRELPKVDADALHGFAGLAGARGKEADYDTVIEHLEHWMGRIIRSAATGEAPGDILPGDGAAVTALAGRGALESWLEAWDKIRQSLTQGAALNLDRKQLLLTAFFTLQAAAKPAA